LHTLRVANNFDAIAHENKVLYDRMLKGSVREGLALKICHEIKQRFDVRIRLAVSAILAYGSQVRASKR